MGKSIYIEHVREFMRNTIVFRAKDVEILTKNRRYGHLLLHKLVERNEIKRVVKGWYSIYDDPMVAVFCFKPAYVGLQEALSLHGLWEQETNVVIITTLKARTGIRKVFESNTILHRIGLKYFFGYDYLKYGNFFIPVSDIEKTLIDLIYFNEIPDEEVVSEIKKKMNKQKLYNYLRKFPVRIRTRVKKII